MEITARINAELVGQPHRKNPVRLERIGLSSAAIVSEHQLTRQRLAQRSFRDRGLQVVSDVEMVSEGDLDSEQTLLQTYSEIVERGRVRQSNGIGLDIVERVTAPQRQSFRDRRSLPERITGVTGGVRSTDQGAHLSDVDLVIGERESITPVGGHNHSTTAGHRVIENSPEPRDMDVNRRPRVPRL
nr:hypothetical protein [Rhodococcus wratislaviensis]